jgi:hypothetical protein
MNRYEAGTAIAIILIAIVAMVDSFKKSGWTPSGPDAGWYPFWSAAMMAIGAAAVLFIVVRAKSSRPFFSSAEGVWAFLKISIPMVVAVGLMGWLGFYLISVGLLGYFGRWIGKYRWVWTGVLAVSIPLGLYLAFEQGFKVPLPKSVLHAGSSVLNYARGRPGLSSPGSALCLSYEQARRHCESVLCASTLFLNESVLRSFGRSQ